MWRTSIGKIPALSKDKLKYPELQKIGAVKDEKHILNQHFHG